MKIFNKEELPYIKYPFIYGALFGLAVFFYRAFFSYDMLNLTKTDLGLSMSFNFFGMIATEVIFVLLWAGLVYLTLIKASKVVPDLISKYKYSVALYLLVSFEIVMIVLNLVFFKRFVIGMGLLPFALTFIIPAVYEPKDKNKTE